MADVLGQVTHETDSETEIHVQEVYQGGSQDKAKGREAESGRPRAESGAVAVLASATLGGLWKAHGRPFTAALSKGTQTTVCLHFDQWM